MPSETINPISVRRRRRLPSRAMIVPNNPLPIGLFFTGSNRWQVCTQAPIQQVNPIPADPFRYAVGKAVLAFGSWGIEERMKELQRIRHQGTKSDQQWNQVEAFLLPILKEFVDDMRTQY